MRSSRKLFLRGAWLVLVFSNQTTFGLAATKTKAIESSLQIGSCRLQDLRQARDVISCSQAAASAYQVSSINHLDSYQVISSDLYSSLHWEKKHSFHLAGSFRQIYGSGQKASKLKSDLVAYQWGKLGGRAPWLVSVGKQELPFGVHWRIHDDLLSVWQDDRFYFAPHPSIKVGYHRDAKFSAELGVGAEQNNQENGNRLDRVNTYSLRTSYDMNSDHGTRWVFSLGGKESGLRTYGMGLIFRAPKGAVTQFEWIRAQAYPQGGGDFSQIFRLLLAGPNDGNSQTSFTFDLARGLYRQSSLIYSYHFWQYMALDSALVFHRLEHSRTENFYLVLGINGHV